MTEAKPKIWRKTFGKSLILLPAMFAGSIITQKLLAYYDELKSGELKN